MASSAPAQPAISGHVVATISSNAQTMTAMIRMPYYTDYIAASAMKQ
jgi:hypothetical protein